MISIAYCLFKKLWIETKWSWFNLISLFADPHRCCHGTGRTSLRWWWRCTCSCCCASDFSTPRAFSSTSRKHSSHTASVNDFKESGERKKMGVCCGCCQWWSSFQYILGLGFVLILTMPFAHSLLFLLGERASAESYSSVDWLSCRGALRDTSDLNPDTVHNAPSPPPHLPSSPRSINIEWTFMGELFTSRVNIFG